MASVEGLSTYWQHSVFTTHIQVYTGYKLWFVVDTEDKGTGIDFLHDLSVNTADYRGKKVEYLQFSED